MRFRDMPRELLLMTLAMIIANTAGMMFFPLLPLYLEDLGASVQQVGLFFTLQVILALTSRIFGGWVSDHTGRLPTIALGGMSGVIGYLGFTLAPTWQWVFIGALFGEISASLVAPSYQAYVAEQAPEGKTSSTFGLVNGLFAICMIIGPLLGGFIADRFGFKTLLWTATAIYATASVMRLWMARGTRFKAGNLRPRELVQDIRGMVALLLGGGLLTWLFVVDGLIDATGQMSLPFAPKYITEFGDINKSAFGALMALMNLVSALMMWPSGMLADRIGERRVIALGAGVTVIAWGMLAALPYRAFFVLVFIIGGLGGALFGPAFSALVSKAVPKKSLGITWGIFMTAMGILAIPAPYLGGLIYDHISPHLTFAVAALCAVFAIPLALRYLRVPETLDTAPDAAPAVIPDSAEV